MFKKRKPTHAELCRLIMEGVGPEVFGPKLYEATMGKYFLDTENAEAQLAYNFGATLKSVDQLDVFYKAVTPVDHKHNPGVNFSRWITLANRAAHGYLDTAGVASAQDALVLARFLHSGDQKQLIKHAMPFLTERDDIVDFACLLHLPETLMIFAIALGYVPVNSLDEAIKIHREKLRREEEDRRNQSATISVF